MSFDPYAGLDRFIDTAQKKWGVTLNREHIAGAAADVAREYAKGRDTFNFEFELEYWLNTYSQLTQDEQHAAKFVVGKVFARNNQKSRTVAATWRDFAPHEAYE